MARLKDARPFQQEDVFGMKEDLEGQSDEEKPGGIIICRDSGGVGQSK